VPTALPIFNSGYGAGIHPEFSPERRIAFFRLPDFEHLLSGKFGFRVRFAVSSPLETKHLAGVSDLLFSRGIFQIFNAIVLFVAVLVVYGHALWSRAKECFRNQQVDREGFRSFVFGWTPQANAKITRRAHSGLQNSRRAGFSDTLKPCPAARLCGVMPIWVDAFNSPQRTRLVQAFVPQDWIPSFFHVFHIIKEIGGVPSRLR